MLLGLSACGDIDSPEFPPSEVKSEVKEAVDFSYTELENLESTHGMHLNYHNRVYVLSADIVLDLLISHSGILNTLYLLIKTI